MPYGSNVGLDQAVTIKEQWHDGQVVMDPSGWVTAYAQMIDPMPRILLNVQFRRALMYATNRQELTDTLMQGLLPVADSVFSPGTAEFEATKSGIVHYDFDPSRAARMYVLLEHGSPKSARFYPVGHMGHTPDTALMMLNWMAEHLGV